MPARSRRVQHHLPAPRATMKRVRRIGFPILFISLIATGMGQSLFFALFPPVARDLGLNEIQVSTIFTLSAILWTLLSPVWGRQSDIWGRKPIILMGILGFAISTSGFGLLLLLGMRGLIPLMWLYALMILVRAIFGAFGSGTPSAAQAYVADRTLRQERTEGVAAINAAFGMGTIVGPGFAAALAAFHLLAPFFMLGAFAVISAIAVGLYLPERRPRARARRARRADSQNRVKVTDSRLRPFLFMGTAISLGQASAMQIAAFFVIDVMEHDASFTAQLVGVAMMSMAMATLFAQLVVIPRFHPNVRQLLSWGAGISALGFALLLLPPSEGLFVFAFSLEGFGAGLLRPGIGAGASLVVRRSEQGSAAGLINSTAAAGIILVPITVMPLYGLAPQWPFALAFALMLGITAISLLPRFRRLDTLLDIEAHEARGVTPHKLG